MLKRWLKNGLRRLGVDAVRYHPMPERLLNLLALAVRLRVAEHGPFAFVQVGANDGVRSDPLRELVLQHRLPGLLVEPLPDLFEKLQKNYAGQPGLRFANCAVGPTDGTLTLYRVRPDAPVPDYAQGLASFDRSHLTARKFGVPKLESYVEPATVPCRTLPGLLKEYEFGDVGLLQVDTEGFDCRIVMAALSAGLRPSIVNYEYVHCTLPEQATCKQALADAGYHFADWGRDTLAVVAS